ncbi:diguanylate cyclase [Acidithiobacillus sp. AMEEHan]|uniref:diguanylate cyclase n=1 Tax=Acidithiobacillus sp. AMEEHan TaxID=2994951 RepID=UPI0027E441F3|nr:diguanylate cyclase [Acidithiobacillus sp. AMEEHan]
MVEGSSTPISADSDLQRGEFFAAIEEASRRAFVELCREPEVAAYVATLDSSVLEHMQAAQHRHFARLLLEEDPAACEELSRKLGAVHHRLGLPADWLVMASELFSAQLRRALAAFASPMPELEQRISRRLASDLVIQLRSMRQLESDEELVIEKIDILLLSEPDEKQLLQRILNKIVLLPGVDGAWIGKPHGGELQPIAVAGAQMASYLEQVQIRVDAGPTARGPMGRAWSTGQPVAVDDLETDPLFLPWRETVHGTGAWRSTIACPVEVAGNLEALFGVYSRTPRYFSAPSRRRTLMRLTRMLGIALEKQDQHERLERSNRLYQTFLSQGDIIMRSRSAATILRQTCHRLVENGLFSTAFVVQPDSHGYFAPISAAGKNSDKLTRARVHVDQREPASLLATAWRERRMQYHNHYLEDPKYQSLAGLVAEFGWNSLAVIPIQHQGDLWALLCVASAQQGYFDHTLLSALARTAKILGFGLDELALKNQIEAEREEQSWRAMHDSLTELPNRAAYLAELPKALARTGECLLAVCMMDLDDFKPVNDQYGHAAGDLVLQVVARRLRAAIREDDLVARFGGDEFALLLGKLASLDVLECVLNRVQSAIREKIVLADGSEVQVGSSLGVTLYPLDDAPEEILLRHADQALYAAKSEKGDLGKAFYLYDGSDGIVLLPEPSTVHGDADHQSDKPSAAGASSRNSNAAEFKQ